MAKQKLYDYITSNFYPQETEHIPINQLQSVTTYARTLGVYTALYIPFELKTDQEVLDHINSNTKIRPPYFRNQDNIITNTAVTPQDFLLQNQQHIQFLTELQNNTPTAQQERTFIVEDNILTETKPLTMADLLTKKGVISRNHLTRTVTYSAHAVAIPDHTLTHPEGLSPVIGIPRTTFNKLNLSTHTPVMFLRNPVIKTDGVHFAYPVPTPHEHAFSIHPYFCKPTNLDFDGDQIIVYRIMHPINITEVTALMSTRYPNPLPLPTDKDYALAPHNLHQLSLQDYNTPHPYTARFQAFLSAKPSSKFNPQLNASARDLLKSRTPQEFQQHLTQSQTYKGMFQSKADIGKTGGLYKKLVYAFPHHISQIMAVIEPISQATLDQKHTTKDFNVDRLINAFNNLEHPSNLEYLTENLPEEHHEFLTYLHEQLSIKPLAFRHKDNQPLLTYLGTKFTPSLPTFFNPPTTDNIFTFITSLTQPTQETLQTPLPTLTPITEYEASLKSIKAQERQLEKSELIPQKFLKDQVIYEHRFNKTLVDKTNPFAEYLTRQAVSVPHDDNNLYILPPKGFCPYQRTEKDPSNPEPITFTPTFANHTTSATPLNIPYLHNTEHARLVYACNNIKQALQLRTPEHPTCRTKYHRTLQVGTNLLTTFYASPYTYEDAVMISKTASQKLATVDGTPAKPGDKITGRHGNKSVISIVLPDDQMPYGAEIAFSPMAITSRQNFGFLAEIQSNMLHNNQPHIETPIETLLSQPIPELILGHCYILRNSHTAQSGHKDHALPHSYTQYMQPVNGERISLSHIYALETLNLRNLIAEFYSFRSNKDQITNRTAYLHQEPQSLKVIRHQYISLTRRS